MKFIFFLIPFLLLGFLPNSFAEKGLNYDDNIIDSYPNGTQVHQLISVPERIVVNDEYVDFRFINGAEFLSVETGHGSIKLNKDTCSFDFYKKGVIDGEPLFTDSIVAKMANNGTETWNEVTQITNAICEASGNENQLVAKKFVSGVGLLEYKYINTGSAWKTQLEATNLSLLTNKKFGFTQTIDLNRDTVHYGGGQKNLDNYADTTFDRTWLENNQGKVINFLNDVSFDFDLGFENLKSIAVYDTGANKSKLSFNYLYNAEILLPNEIIIIDPTYTQNTGGDSRGIYNGQPRVGLSQQFSTGHTLIGKTVTSTSFWALKAATPTGTLTAYIKDSSGTIKATMGTLDVATLTGSFVKKSFSSSSAVITNGDRITFEYGGGGGADQVQVDTSAGDVDANALMEELVAGVWGDLVGTDMRYEVIYTTTNPPWAVTDLTNTSETTTTESLDWTAPYAGGGNQVIIGYQINKTSPWGTPNTILVNDTGTTTTDYVATGLTAGTQYSFRVSAWTNNTAGHPFNNATGNILNVTTPLNSYLTVAPANLNVFPVICDPAKLNLEWTSGSMQNINGYRIQRETPVGGGFVTIVSNTTTTLTYYNNTGLTANNNYNYRVYSLNGSGISGASNTDSSYTCHLPNAVTDLTGTATGLSTIELEWTAPVPYSTLLGYMVNYTTPEGDPITIFDPPHTGSSTTSATVFGLTIGNDYSFRVSPVTVFGSNATGNIFNATTTTNFVLGNLTSPDVTNTDDFKIFYERTDVNATSILLEVTYPESYTLTCNMLFKFSRDNNTYTGLTETPITGPGGDTDNVVSSFTFNGANTEIITINCYDESIPDSAKYIITITQFELLDQIANFRNGTYGTMGQIGGLDLITLIVVIIGMIGFNRVTPIAGVIFTVITVGALSAFGIIEMYQIIFPALALIVLLAYTRTRSSD